MMRSGGSPTGMTLRQQVQQQRSILAEARQRYGEDHPDIKRIQRNIDSLEARIKSGESADTTLASDSPMAVQLQTQLNATDTQIAAMQQRGLELRRKMTDLETRMGSAPQVEREYPAVTRDLDSARAKFQDLLKRQMDAEVSEAAIANGTADKFHIKSRPSTAGRPGETAAHRDLRGRLRAGARGRDVLDRVRAAARSDGTRRARHPRYPRRDAADRSAGHRAIRTQPASQDALGVLARGGRSACGRLRRRVHSLRRGRARS